MSGAGGPINYDGIQLCGVTTAANFGGQRIRWPQPDVSWGIAAGLPGFAADSFRAAIAEGFARWSRVCGVLPKFVEDAGRANIVVGLQTIGPGGVLADCELPVQQSMSQRCRMRIDTAEAWCISDNPPPNKIDLVRTVCHELGHGLGLDHLGGGNLMAPTYSTQIKDPQAGDIAEMVARYGLPIAQPTPTDPPATADDWAALVSLLEQGARIVARIGRQS